MKDRTADPAAEERLELMPRSVRDKLDRVGIKIHLKDWQAMPLQDRERLRDLPCDSPEEVLDYAATAETLVLQVTGKPAEQLKPR